ncbi:unnamed protein product [Lasius platythorax]|uniref:Uncharacterized protein n=1 Tax=Lasius platythorax TaxID=488582 RepID=A0AAV2N6E8_9HYME
MSYHNRRLLSKHACSSPIQMQKLGSVQLVCKLHEGHDHPSHLVCHSPPLDYKVFVFVISGLPLFPRIMFFHSITWTSAAMHCNRATFLSHGQGGAPSWSNAAIINVVPSSRSFTHVADLDLFTALLRQTLLAESDILLEKLKTYGK